MAKSQKDLHEECEQASCFLPSSRRDFLRQSALAAAAALMGVGMARASALAMPLEIATGRRRGDHLVTYPIPAADGAQIDKDNQVILVRWSGALYAFNLSCPHQNTALRWDEGDKGFYCPKHHSRFQADGDYVPGSGRATRNMDRFAIDHDATSVHVNVDKLYQEDTDGAQWKAAMVNLT